MKQGKTMEGHRGRRGYMLSYQDIKGLVDSGCDRLQWTSKKSIKLRKYHLTRQELSQLMSESKENGTFPNPYSRTGAYYAGIQALYNLGSNEWHKMIDIYNQMRSIMSKEKGVRDLTHWEIFCGRGLVSDETSGKKVADKIAANYAVLQRRTGMNPYGLKLAQVNAYVRIKHIGHGVDMHKEYMLCTDIKSIRSIMPLVVKEEAPVEPAVETPKKRVKKVPEVVTTASLKKGKKTAKKLAVLPMA
jgi:hypothetical protein